MKHVTERAVGGESLQDRARIGEAAGLDHDTAEVRQFPAIAFHHHAAQRLLQVAAGGAAQAPIAKQHGFIGARAHQRVVDARRAEFVDDDRGALSLWRCQKTLEQRGLPGTEKSGDHSYRHARATFAFEPAPKASSSWGGEKLVQKSISNVYSPPVWRSTVYTTSRSSTNTSLSCTAPAGVPFGGGGTKVATSFG